MSADKLDAMSIRTNLAGSVRVLWWEVPEIQEMGFNIASKDELDYALGLIKQSYDRAKSA